MSLDYRVTGGGPLRGSLRVPGDKSISHRSIMFGALAEGEIEVNGFLEGTDCLATLSAFRQLGVRIDTLAAGHVRIHGVGLHGLQAARQPLDLGNSGTAMRLMTGILAGQPFDSVLIGDESLSRRPMRRVTEPLKRMGASIETTEAGTPPIHIYGGRELVGIEYMMPVASAQVKSAVLLAGLYAHGKTCVTEPAPTRDHTERMLMGMGYGLERQEHVVCLHGGGHLCGGRINVPADISSAAFFMVGASVTPGSDLLLEHVGMNPTRIGVIEILRLMGANIELLNEREESAEPVADIRVRHAALQGIDIPEALVPLAIDEFPVLFVAAACAQGVTRLSGAAELRVKESDRIQVMADGLQALGIRTEVMPDGLVIEGRGYFDGGEVETHGDHRVAMAFVIAGLVARGEIIIHDCANVETSFPSFLASAQHAGIDVEAWT